MSDKVKAGPGAIWTGGDAASMDGPSRYFAPPSDDALVPAWTRAMCIGDDLPTAEDFTAIGLACPDNVVTVGGLRLVKRHCCECGGPLLIDARAVDHLGPDLLCTEHMRK